MRCGREMRQFEKASLPMHGGDPLNTSPEPARISGMRTLRTSKLFVSSATGRNSPVQPSTCASPRHTRRHLAEIGANSSSDSPGVPTCRAGSREARQASTMWRRAMRVLHVFLFLIPVSLWAADRTPPNFLLVYIDDLGWTDTSVEMIQGRKDTRSDFYQTPHLERLAREGMVFSSAYAPAPVCTPSRNSMLHGMTPARMLNSTLHVQTSLEEYRGKITLPRALKQADPRYVAAHFGKWHNKTITPSKAGFDISDGPTGNGEGDYMDDMKTHLPENDPKRIVSLTRRSKEFIS